MAKRRPTTDGRARIDFQTGKELQKEIQRYHQGLTEQDLQEIQRPSLDMEDAQALDSAQLLQEEAEDNGVAKSAKTAVFALMILSAFTKIFGFLREVLLAKYYGTGQTAEAYKIAQTIPILLLMVVGAGLATGFIPTYNKTAAHKGKVKANRFMSNTINLALLIGLIFCLIVSLFPGLFVSLFAFGFKGEVRELTMTFTRIAVWGVMFSLVNYIMQPYLQIHENFWVPAMVGIPMNLVFFASYPLAKNTGLLWILPVGIILSSAVQVFWMIPFVHKKGYRWQPILSTKDEDLRHLLMLAAPVILGVAVNQINIIVDRSMATMVMEGGVATLDYANRMNGFVQGIFIYSVMSVVYPRISKLFIRKEYKQVEDMTTNAMVTLSLIIIPSIIGLMVFSKPIIELVFQRGSFGAEETKNVAGAMFFYAPGLIGFAFREILARVFYSMNDTKTPTINAAIAVGINVILNIILSLILGINGLALATSTASILSSVLLMFALRRTGRLRIHYKELLFKMFRIGIAALVMGAGSYFAYRFLSGVISPKLATLMGIMLAVPIYGAVIPFMRIEEVNDLIQMIKGKLKRK